MRLQKIHYEDLSGRAQETYNFQKLSGILADYGYATNWLNVDVESADFIAAHFNGLDIIKVQLKGRLTIDKKYLNKEIYMSFPIDNVFYLVPHDELVEIVGKTTSWLNSSSWIDNGGYSSGSPSEKLIAAIAAFRLS